MDNSGALFKNDRKEKENQPDYKGRAEVNGEEYWLAAWLKTSDKGKYMSIAFTLKEEKSAFTKNDAGDIVPTDEPEEDIPF